MKTYRIENWDVLGCPNVEGRVHIGGQIYGHPDYPDGSWVMSDRVVFFDNENKTAQTMTSGLLQLGEMSEKMRQKDSSLEQLCEEDDMRDAAGRTVKASLQDNFMSYSPDDWGVKKGRSDHKGVDGARQALNDLLRDVFGRAGAPDKKRHH